MIAVLLLTAGLVLGGIGFGIYLVVRPESVADQGAPPPPVTSATAPPVSTSRETTPRETTPEPEPGTGSGSTAVEGSGAGPRETAQDYVTAVNDRDESSATALTCQRTDPGTLFEVTDGRRVRLGEVEVIEGSVASATVRVGDDETALLLENQEDRWCVAI
ncbi:hypothetical protein [Actinophytocola sediminis]